ncbi:uncharacterized protein FIBRA_04183 [Fibroporia radiculosa]|uniref:Nucleoporin Nup186/Nup192/Nup205 n=1 Tax=Fibroporia radiculosa TaxID=599839 RepID=J4IA12_9APHY|nr:uncharacterized protein FIBRA_04183 [Fibroporia radiculosa]CCM02106.1 predicted protein [Fibroporia radiculosa]
MGSISHLRNVLLSAFSSRGLKNGEQEFFEELMAHKPQLVALFDISPRNAQEQRELESGKTTVEGRSLAVNSDFARQAIFVAQQLDCSERYIAGLLQDVMFENPNVSPERCIEATILEFHLRRRHLADCLRYIIEAADLGSTGNAPDLYIRLDMFVRQQLLPAPRSTVGGLSLTLKIFQEIHNLGNVLAKAQTARQNAKSDTVLSSGQGCTGSLGADVLTARCDSLKYERRILATSLYFIGRMGYLAPAEISKLIDWLEGNPRHAMTTSILTTVLAALDIVQPDSLGGRAREMLINDKSFMSYMKKKLDVATQWREPGIKATVLLKWTLFLAETRHRNPSLENVEGFKTEELETQIWNAVQGDCFTYQLRLVGQLQSKQTSFPPVSFALGILSQQEPDSPSETPAEEFKPVILEACESLIRSLISQASSELRKIKQRQEDLLLTGVRGDRSRSFRSSQAQPSARSESDKPAAPPRNDMAVLFSLIGLLYSTLPPERALHFWGAGVVAESQRSTYSQALESISGKLPGFLQWAVWSTQARDVDMMMALYDMLAGLAKGQQCSELAYNFLARGGGDVVPGSSLSSSSAHLNTGAAISWGAIFGLLDSWVVAGTGSRNPPPSQGMGQSQSGFPNSQQWQPQQSHQPPQVAFTQQDVLLAQSFLRLLSTVVTHSVAVRVTISGHARFRAIPTLVSLVPLGIPLELKGAIFETLAAFCQAGAGVAGVDICRLVWTLMERMEVINVRVSSGFGTPLPAVKGVEVELEEVETVYKMYPATIPFLKLLGTLIHTPKDISMKDRVAETEPINTIPETLGHPYRQPGVGPFSSFVIDNVFSRINTREYLRPTDRWRTNDLCLSFVERCLAGFELESLVANTIQLQPKGDAILQLAVHPGYDMMKRMLTSSTLQNSILSYLVDGLNGFDRGLAAEESYFRTTIMRVLRIINRVLEIQDIFLDILLPLLSDINDTAVTGEVPSSSYFVRLDQALSHSPEYVPAVAAYIAYPAYPELMLLSVKILTALAASNSLSQLALLIDRSEESVRILNGFQTIMDTDVLEEVELAENAAEQLTGAGAPDTDEPSPALLQSIRLAILDLFVQNTKPGKPYPNIAHFLLFGGAAAEDQIQDPHALGARRSCMHTILDLLNAGIPRLKGKGPARKHPVSGDPLFAILPALAERCYHVVYQLCKHPRTSEFVMRYLRTREDFFARHLSAVPFKAPATEQVPFIELIYGDGSRVTTTVNNLAAFLRLRSWILELVALELHALTNKGHHKSVAELLELLFGNEEDYLEDGAGSWEADAFRPFHEVGQSHLRMVEFLQSLDFDWSDSLTVKAVELQFLGELNLQSCLQLDESGCEIVDRAALLSILTMARRTLHMQNRVITPAHLEQLMTETSYIMESCAIENHRREVLHAVANGYEAWRRLLDMSLIKCFERLPQDRRENMLFDLLHVMPLTLRSAHVQESTAVLIAEAMLSAITKLREDRHHQVILQSAGGDVQAGTLPVERVNALLRSILECVAEYGHLELVRGNLYASLINYFHLVMSADIKKDPDFDSSSFGMSLSMSMSASRDDFAFGDSLASPSSGQLDTTSTQGSAILNSTLAILKSGMERLVTIISRDAIDGSEVWRSVAFMLLDSLIRLSRSEKYPAIFQALARHGFMSGFVGSLKESDSLLQAVLKPDPDDLNPLYVYEAKMSLLIRMSQTRQGAERLLEARVIPILAGCDYLDARPEGDQAFLDHDTFLPSAIQRYHQLVLPTLQLVSGMVVTLGNRHTTATTQALQFLSGHRDTVILLLKNEVDELSLSLMEEIRLLVSLSASVIQLVPKTELLSNSGFGTIHAAISGLAARCLGNQHWSDDIKPRTDAEFSDAGVGGLGFGIESKFRVTVRQQDRLLQKAIIAYLGTASDFTEPEFTLVLSPVITTPKQDERSTPTVPSVGDTIEALHHLCDDLAGSLRQIISLTAELSSRNHIRVDNIQDIVPVSDQGLLGNLDIRQKQSLISRELEKWRTEASRTALIALSSLEMLLLLLWRHLVFYCEGRHINNPDLKGSISHTMRFATSPDVETLIAEVTKKLVPALQRLQTLDLTEDTLGKDWHSYHSYVEIMSRRLKDTTGLHDQLEESSQNGL